MVQSTAQLCLVHNGMLSHAALHASYLAFWIWIKSYLAADSCSVYKADLCTNTYRFPVKLNVEMSKQLLVTPIDEYKWALKQMCVVCVQMVSVWQA